MQKCVPKGIQGGLSPPLQESLRPKGKSKRHATRGHRPPKLSTAGMLFNQSWKRCCKDKGTKQVRSKRNRRAAHRCGCTRPKIAHTSPCALDWACADAGTWAHQDSEGGCFCGETSNCELHAIQEWCTHQSEGHPRHSFALLPGLFSVFVGSFSFVFSAMYLPRPTCCIPFLVILLVAVSSEEAVEPIADPEDCPSPAKEITLQCPYESVLMEECYKCYYPPDKEGIVCDGWSEEDIVCSCWGGHLTAAPAPAPAPAAAAAGSLGGYKISGVRTPTTRLCVWQGFGVQPRDSGCSAINVNAKCVAGNVFPVVYCTWSIDIVYRQNGKWKVIACPFYIHP